MRSVRETVARVNVKVPANVGRERGEADRDRTPTPSAPAAPSRRSAGPTALATAVILLASATLIFARLGHYPLWDDEAITAMTARAVWRTGDTSARVDDHNLLAYRNGLLLRDLKDRFTPPLQFYLLAPFIGLFGDTNFACRLPFAIAGLLTVAMMLRWLHRQRPPPLLWWAAAIFILSDTQFFLFIRQCRYYALAMLFTTAAAYFYIHRDGRRRTIVLLSLALVALLASQYLNYAAAIVCLVLDYFFWERRRSALKPIDWLILIVPQLLVGGVVCSIWNPLARGGASGAESSHWLIDHLRLLWWNGRDLVTSGFVLLPLLILCPLLYSVRRNTAALRAPAALAIYVAMIVFCAASPVHNAFNAEVRYLAPLLPLGIGIAIIATGEIFFIRTTSLRMIASTIAISSLVIEPTAGRWRPSIGPTAFAYYRELIHPQDDPYTPTIGWIRAHVAVGQSVFVQPDWMMYPLMFRAHQAMYAWQLTDPPKSEFADLPALHFRGRVPPDYMIAFGPWRKEIGEAMDHLAARDGVRYQLIDTIHTNWQDRYRPEIIWRSFKTELPTQGNEIYVFRAKRPS